MIPEIHIEDYHYDLPDERIAKYPLAERDSSKLLCYDGGKVSERIFRELPGLLPEDSVMVFNDTKVVPARLHFVRESGARIEVFCLEPVDPPEYNISFASTCSCKWKCVVGNAKRWKGDTLTLFNPENDADVAEMGLCATLVSREGRTAVVEFTWKGGHPFSKVLEICGTIPIPPYLNRETEAIDYERYQTMYARIRGSVAAPTAGLHFTPKVLQEIDSRGIHRENVCLHVGAGTFLPVKGSLVSEHPMHREPFVISLDLLKRIRNNKGKLIAVGTTSVRTLESLYYVGLSCIEKGAPEDVAQWVPYEKEYSLTTGESIDAIIAYLEANGLKELKIGTKIIIVPGFRFRLVDAMVTNFHQPESTLILLISAFVGGDWLTIYDYALSHGFRFLSYGDSSLLFRTDIAAKSFIC
ncbi:MAG: S-adenosylmethionine:tRNA ribosyltransferase-isomerase [Bacteroidales bacterium]|nr:S-adenosylmethionine:tRNA ribosyltransferase-isomerase [Bacteroidales bacterium]